MSGTLELVHVQREAVSRYTCLLCQPAHLLRFKGITDGLGAVKVPWNEDNELDCFLESLRSICSQSYEPQLAI